MLYHCLLVAFGGGIGAVLRFLIASFTVRLTTETFPSFPTGTLVVNLLGCLAIGAFSVSLIGNSSSEREALRLFVLMGILGGFTTFSTFGLESFDLLREKQWLILSIYVLASNLGGLGAVWLGWKAGNALGGA